MEIDPVSKVHRVPTWRDIFTLSPKRAPRSLTCVQVFFSGKRTSAMEVNAHVHLIFLQHLQHYYQLLVCIFRTVFSNMVIFYHFTVFNSQTVFSNRVF